MTYTKALTATGPFADEHFVPGNEQVQMLASMKILVVGAGGLGCEILKNLALMGFHDIHVIDMDTIDLSNLNRQFLFREHDVGKSKAEVAAKFVMNRVPGVNVTPHFCKIQDKGDDFYRSFTIVICGLDSIDARRWINATLVNLVDDTPESVKPLIDGGTEGFMGQAKVILPTMSSCYECALDMFGKQVTYPICTIANTPRVPEHCIEWASEIAWPQHRPDTKLDKDNPEDVLWVYQQAAARAAQFNIQGVTYNLTLGVIKRIIPAIASTNAIIAAACCAEAFKISTSCNPYLDNHMMYTGQDSVYTYTFQHQRKEECPVCGSRASPVTVDADWTLQEFIDYLNTKPDIKTSRPSLRSPTRSLYMQAPPPLEASTRPNLDKKLRDLVDSGDELVVTDPSLPFSLRLVVRLAGL